MSEFGMKKNEHKNGETVQVQLFASAREKAGSETVHLPVNPYTTMCDLLKTLHAAYPELRNISGRWAVNEEFAEDTRHVRAGDEIAFIPPVSGG